VDPQTDSDQNDEAGGEADLQNILVSIASIGPDADRETLVTTIDQSIEALINTILASEDPKVPSPEIAKSVEVAMQFLEACAATDDEDFRDHIAKRAQELLAVLTTGKRPAPEPEPVEPEYEVHHDVFEEAFTDYFCDFIHHRLQEFHIDMDDAQPAFMLRPTFAERFVKAVRDFVVPGMIVNRRIRNMSDSVIQSNFHQVHFFSEFTKPQEENVVRLIWNSIMTDFHTELRKSEPAAAEEAKPEKKKGGLLGSLKKKKEKPAAKSAKTVSGSNEKADGFWAALQEGASKDEYDAPRVEDFAIFAVLMDYYQDFIDDNKSAVRQLLEQETGVEDEEMDREGREGATRDWLYKMVPNLPPHLGELLVLWCFHTYENLFKPSIAKSFLAGQGTTDDARERAVPYFFRWFNPENYPYEDDNPFAGQKTSNHSDDDADENED
jgi:hypothetical protein